VGAREIRRKRKATRRKRWEWRRRALDKPEVYKLNRARAWLLLAVNIFLFFPSRLPDRSRGQKEMRRMKRNGKLCRLGEKETIISGIRV